MQLRHYAESIVFARELSVKLTPPSCDLRDDEPGSALRVLAPTRPNDLQIAEARAAKVPPLSGMQDLSQRRRILHALANHELQAAELFAWMLLAFPDEPSAFRRGLLQILIEEQKHCQLYIDRLVALGGRFGDHPVTGHFWHRIDDVKSPLDFICVMGLTFENANLDFAQAYADAARRVGDLEMAAAIDIVHRDEIRHVAFAWRWLQRYKPSDKSSWQAFEDTLQFPLNPSRARGVELDRESRVQAGFDEDFIDRLAASRSTRPNGRSR